MVEFNREALEELQRELEALAGLQAGHHLPARPARTISTAASTAALLSRVLSSSPPPDCDGHVLSESIPDVTTAHLPEDALK